MMQTTVLLNKDDDYGFLTLGPVKNYRRKPNYVFGVNHQSTKRGSADDLLEPEKYSDKSYFEKTKNSTKSVTEDRPTLRRGLSASQPTLNKSKNKSSYKVRLAISSDILNKISDDKQEKCKSNIVFRDERCKEKNPHKSWWKKLFSSKHPKIYKGPIKLKDSVHVTSSVEVVEDLSFDDQNYAPNLSRDSNHNVKPIKIGKLKRFGSFLAKKDKSAEKDSNNSDNKSHEQFNERNKIKTIKIRNLSLSPNARRERNRNNGRKDKGKNKTCSAQNYSISAKIKDPMSDNEFKRPFKNPDETEVKIPIKSFVAAWNKPSEKSSRQRKVLVHIDTRDEISVENGHPVWSSREEKSANGDAVSIRENTYFESSFIGKLSSATCSTPGNPEKNKSLLKNEEENEEIQQDDTVRDNDDTIVKSRDVPDSTSIGEAESKTTYFEVTSSNNGNKMKETSNKMWHLQHKSFSCENVSSERVFAITGIVSDKIPDIIARKHPYVAKTSSEPLRHMARCLRQIQQRGEHRNIGIKLSNNFSTSPRRCLSDSNLSTPMKSPSNNDFNESSKPKQHRSTKTDEILTRMRKRIQRLELLRETTPVNNLNNSVGECCEGLPSISGSGSAFTTTTKVSISSPVMMSLPLPKISQIAQESGMIGNKNIQQRNTNSNRFMRLLQAELNKRVKMSNNCTGSSSITQQPPAVKTIMNEKTSCAKQVNEFQISTSSQPIDSSSKSIKYSNQDELKHDPSGIQSTSNSLHINVQWKPVSSNKMPIPSDSKLKESSSYPTTYYTPKYKPGALSPTTKNLRVDEDASQIINSPSSSETYNTNMNVDFKNPKPLAEVSPSESRRSEIVKSTVLSEMKKIKQKYSFVLPCTEKFDHEVSESFNNDRYNRLSSSSSMEAFLGSESSSFVSSNTSINSRDTSVMYEYVLSSDGSSTLCNSSENSDDTITNFDDFYEHYQQKPAIKWICKDFAFSTEL